MANVTIVLNLFRRCQPNNFWLLIDWFLEGFGKVDFKISFVYFTQRPFPALWIFVENQQVEEEGQKPVRVTASGEFVFVSKAACVVFKKQMNLAGRF